MVVRADFSFFKVHKDPVRNILCGYRGKYTFCAATSHLFEKFHQKASLVTHSAPSLHKGTSAGIFIVAFLTLELERQDSCNMQPSYTYSYGQRRTRIKL